MSEMCKENARAAAQGVRLVLYLLSSSVELRENANMVEFLRVEGRDTRHGSEDVLSTYLWTSSCGLRGVWTSTLKRSNTDLPIVV